MKNGWPDRLVLRPLSKSDAHQVVSWKYGGPWQIYNLTATEELPSADDGYMAVADADTDRIVGFFCTGPEARVPGLEAVFQSLVADEVPLDVVDLTTGQGLRASGQLF
ncbi:hypothetical protein [Nocardia wallacei]|uniref:Uncharacterized protein n=1 Tax=Nocardia wallacei TaxID=480035 RepID=A0A7G1KM36_9NOCA|nr:hypothetical protein [Nocardia wallacei]BCK56262.1 hypothetical protein NWFMUON74_40340 [Nocardia wallacei]